MNSFNVVFNDYLIEAFQIVCKSLTQSIKNTLSTSSVCTDYRTTSAEIGALNRQYFSNRGRMRAYSEYEEALIVIASVIFVL